jgi:Gnt-I system low-affinity gluconate transporter
MVFGTLLGMPMVLVGWLGPGRWWARRQFVDVPAHLAAKNEDATGRQQDDAKKWSALDDPANLPSFRLALSIVLLPLLLSILGFGMKLLQDLERLPTWMLQPAGHALVDWFRFLGHPTMAMFIPTGLAFLLLGVRRGMNRDQLAKIAQGALQDVGGMALMIGTCGAFKQVIQDSGAGQYIAGLVLQAPLTPVAVAFLVAVLVRITLASATAAIMTASGLLVGLAERLPGQETLLVLAVATGVTFMTQPGDSGFWLVKEYCNLSVRQVMTSFNGCRILMALTGLTLLLAAEAWLM